MATFGQPVPDLTRAIRKLAAAAVREVGVVRLSDHAQDEMDADSFDHEQVMECLRKGTAYTPEVRRNRLCSNVIHRGLHIRVVVGGLDRVDGDWSRLESVTVVTVMRIE